MIIEPRDIEDLEKRLQRHLHAEQAANTDDGANNSYPATRYLYRNPHLLLAAGYDEFRLVRRRDSDSSDIPRMFPRHRGGAAFPLGFEAILRKKESGAWHLFQGLKLPNSADRYMPTHRANEKEKSDRSLRLLFDEGWAVREHSANDLLCSLQQAAKVPVDRTSVLAFSNLWSPSKVRLNEIEIIDSTKNIIESIKSGRETLDQIGWRDLEEVVAEILRAKGMRINVTPRSHDGGRDIIAKGELLGEPLTFAVEVKQKSVVPISDARSTLYSNRHFPALMLVTSGRFSAGVVSEKMREENCLRLILKDGVAVSQWIQAYQ